MIICEGICFFAGLYFLFTGRVRLWGGKTVRGEKARLMGLLLLVPIPVAFIAAFFFAGSAVTDDELMQAVISASLIELIAIITVLITVAYIYNRSPGSDDVAAPSPQPGFSGGGFGLSSGILTVAEAARYLRVSEQEILNMIDSGQITAARIGSDYRISKSVIDELLRNPKS